MVLALAGCAGRLSVPETPSATPTETPVAVGTSTPSPTPTGELIEPATAYTGAATCTNLIDADSVAELTDAHLSLTDEGYAEKTAGEPSGGNEPLAVGSVALHGGLICGWSSGYTVDVTYTYGPLDDAVREQVLASLDAHGYVLVDGAGYDRYDPGEDDEGWGSFAIGASAWASSHTFGDGDTLDLLDEVVANAPAWDEPEQLPPASTEPLSTEAATPADAPYLTTAGLGDLRLGQPVPASNEFVAWHPDTCFGSWLTKGAYGDYQLGTNAFALYTSEHKKNGTLQFIQLSDDTIPTKSGVRIGDSEGRLLATYGDLEKIDQADATLYAISDDLGHVVFEVAKHNSLIGAYRAGEIIGIVAITAGPGGVSAPSQFAPCTL